MTSGLSRYSALSLVRLRIHALRQSTELFEVAHIFPREGGLKSVFGAMLGSSADTCTVSVSFGLSFSWSFSVKVDSDP